VKSTRAGLKVVGDDEVREWYAHGPSLTGALHSIGQKRPDPEYLEDLLGQPYHLRFVVERLAQEASGAEGEDLPADALDSLPFWSLCHGLFLPLSGLSPERTAQLFGILVPPAPTAAAREELLRRFVAKEVGLTLDQKLACILGDPFYGKAATLKRDSLLALLATTSLTSRRELLDRLPVVGEVAVLFAESRHEKHASPPLAAAEVLETLRFLPGEGRTEQFRLLRSLLSRMGKLEAYFLAKLILRKAGFGFDYQGPLLARILAAPYGADEGQVAHAIALTSAFHVARVLHEGGKAALQRIHVQPLVPIRPALASSGQEELKKLPTWVERKYDGIRLMLHKSTDSHGSVVCGAYTRNRNDWLELVRGLDAEIRLLPCRSAIVDGELHGTVVDLDGVRPANVYDVHTTLQGTRVPPVALRFAAFDLVYLDGQDLTALPLRERRRRLAGLLAPVVGLSLPVPITLSEGQLASNKDDWNRLYHHYKAQGYEGVIAKDLDGPYLMGERDPSWVKRKGEITLDLVLLGAVLAVTTKENVGSFGSFVIGARGRAPGEFVDVGDVAGVDKAREAGIQAEILESGLLTGRRFDRPSASGVRPGFELRPQIVVTVKFEGVVRDNVTKKLSLRDLKLVAIRTDKQPGEADSVEEIEAIFLRQRMG
jgi:DNA ligase-1